MTLSLNMNESLIAKAIEYGYDKARCSMTGQVISVVNHEALDKAIDYIRFESPMLDDEQIMDKLAMRWLIQSSRPSMHLVSFESYESYRWLYQNHPRDLLAILMSRVLFEHSKLERERQTTTFLNMRLDWLVELQDSEEFMSWGKKAQDLLDKLVELDAIHSIRNALRSQVLKDDAKFVRDRSVSFDLLTTLVDKITDEGMKHLARAQYAPDGNRQSLSAALVAKGMLPEQVILEEERQARESESRRRAIAAINSRNADKNGKVTVIRGEKAVVSLQQIGAVIPPKMAEKYAAALEKKKPTPVASTAKKEKKPSKAALRFAAFTETLGLGDFKL